VGCRTLDLSGPYNVLLLRSETTECSEAVLRRLLEKVNAGHRWQVNKSEPAVLVILTSCTDEILVFDGSCLYVELRGEDCFRVDGEPNVGESKSCVGGGRVCICGISATAWS
jgi:hypothetical protein